MENNAVKGIRCPMCGKANSPGLEVCEFCGARLVPLGPSAGMDSGSEGRTEGSGQEEPGVPDWLARIRSQAAAGRETEDQESEGEAPEPEGEGQAEEGSARAPRRRGETGSLLDRLKSFQEPEEEGPGSAVEPERPQGIERAERDVSEQAEAPTGMPSDAAQGPGRGWRETLEEARRAENRTEEGGEAGEVPDWLQTFADELDEGEAQEIPPWLARIRAQQRKALEGEPAREEREIAQAEAEEEKWWEEALRDEQPPPSATAPPRLPEEAREPSPRPLGEELGPGPMEKGRLEAEESEAFETSSPFPEPPGAGGGATEKGTLKDETAPEEDRGGQPRGGETPTEPQSPRYQPPFESGSFPPGRELVPTEAPERPELELSRPEPEREHVDQEPSSDEKLPHIPALITEEEPETAGEEVEDIDLGSIELPKWLNELQDLDKDELEEERKRAEGLEPAKLPSWLEAMRPLETIRPTPEVEPEEGQVIETSGPLAGLRGALSAEPIVAMPRQPSIGGGRLDVTERQFARAEILQRMVAEESQEIPAAGQRRLTLPLLRWVISALLIFAILIPTMFQGQLFAFPSRWPQELAPLITIVEGLPSDRPVLFVIDYDPSAAPEMERMGEAFLDHVILRGLQVVTISTRPTGPALAEHLLGSLGVPDRLIRGDRYYDLGYLAGGESGVQLFARSPRQAALRGFRTAGPYQAESPWDTPILQDVNSLSDFAAVAVLSSGTESARNWVEQTSSRLGTRPLVMVVSMGISPTIRPYYEAQAPQVDALLSGLSAAVSYEQVLGGSGGASHLWDAYGSGLWVAIGALSVGAAYGLTAFAVELRRRISGNA
jgi:hypothetical protein